MNDHATSFLFGVEQSVSGASWIAPKKAKENLKDLFKQEFDLTEAMSELLVNRNFNIEELSNFFDPKIKNLMPDPLVLKDMDKTINRLLKAILDKETIGIFGDYDVDGACSSAIIYSYLIKLGCKVEVHIPDRFTEGYGPNTQALMKLKEQGCNLIITVDCGITAFEPLKKANEENIDIIIIDHHITEPNLPEAYSIINPNRFDEESKLGYLSAAGVCFLTLVALDRKLRENNIKSNVDLKLYLDLVALATICDVVPLRFLNRAFVSTGLKVMGWRQNHGLKALFDLSNLREIPNEQNLGYIIGPRINAAGRLGNSNLGVQLLCCNSEVEASVIADKLNQLNEKRKDIQNSVLESAIDKLNKEDISNKNVIVLADTEWHEGVIGIVAGRIKDRFHKPSIIISINKDGIGKGSSRSVSGFDIGSAIIAAQQNGILLSGGGHAMAAGLTVEQQKLEELDNFLNERFIKSIKPSVRLKDYKIEADINLRAANKKLVEEFRKIAPFGSENSEPIIAISKIRIKNFRSVGKEGKHFSFIASDESGDTLNCIAFSVAGSPLGDAIKIASNGPLLHLIGYLRENSFNSQPQLTVIDCYLIN